MSTRKPGWTTAFWVVALLTIGWLGFGDGVPTHPAYAAEREGVQAGKDEPAQLEAEVADLQNVSRAFKAVAKIARPGVVHIRVGGGEVAKADSEELERLRERLKDMVPEEQLERWLRRVPPGSGSGIILDVEGHILTNNHVVEGRDDISVILHDERKFKATVVGTDPKTDLAVIKIDAPDLHPLKMGDSDLLEVGDWVIAVGSPFGLQQTVTHGIVSAKGRTSVGVGIDYQDFIQTDASINPGNSGGPLLNMRGEVVGVNTAIATNGDAVNAGIAFTIPSNMAIKIADQLKAHGAVTRGYLGIVPLPIEPADAEIFGLPAANGVLVERIVRRSPADRAGLQIEDVIIAVNDVEIVNYQQFRTLVADLHPDERARLRVIRDGKETQVHVRMGIQPEDLHTPTSEPVEDYRKIARLGMQVRTLRAGDLRAYDAAVRGVVVMGWNTSEKSPVDIQPGEVVVGCNDRPVKSVRDLNEAMKDVPKNRNVRLEILEPTGDRRIVTIKPEAKK